MMALSRQVWAIHLSDSESHDSHWDASVPVRISQINLKKRISKRLQSVSTPLNASPDAATRLTFILLFCEETCCLEQVSV